VFLQIVSDTVRKPVLQRQTPHRVTSHFTTSDKSS